MARLLRASCALLWVALCVGLPACAGAPVQEMSNARQAIKAALVEFGNWPTAP